MTEPRPESSAVPPDSAPEKWLGAATVALQLALLALLGVGAGIFVWQSAASIAHPYPVDYGEAPLIDQAIRLARGESIYRPNLDSPPFLVANYTPLYPLILALVVDRLDSPFQVARLLSALAMLAAALLVGWIVTQIAVDRPPAPGGSSRERIFDADRLSIVVAIGFFLSSPYVVEWAALARVDALALAFALVALAVLVRRGRPRLWLVAVLLAAAVFTRQSYLLAAPLAAFAWQWQSDRRRAWSLAALFAGIVLGLFFGLDWLSNGGFRFHVITANVNLFVWKRLTGQLARLVGDCGLLLAIGAWALTAGRRRWGGWALLAPFTIGSFLSALTVGKVGSNVNYFLELTAALSMLAGVALRAASKSVGLRLALLVILSIQAEWLVHSTLTNVVTNGLGPRRRERAALQRLDAVIRGLPDPVLADEYMGLLTRQRRPLYLQPFEITQLARQGLWDERRLVAEIAAQKFSAVLIHHFGPWAIHRQRWTPSMLMAIDDFYRPVEVTGGTVVYRPVTPTDRRPIPAPQALVGRTPALVWTGSPIAIGAPAALAEPTIALDPAAPDRLAVSVTRFAAENCAPPECRVGIDLFASSDGGRSWSAPSSYGADQEILFNGQVAFAGQDVVVVAKRDDRLAILRSGAADFEVRSAQPISGRPGLRVRPDDGALALTFGASVGDLPWIAPAAWITSLAPAAWLPSTQQPRVSAFDIAHTRSNAPESVQAHFGPNGLVDLLWVWDADPDAWPRTIWMGQVRESSEESLAPTALARTWGPVATASRDGRLAIAFRDGDERNQRWLVAASSDDGRSWVTAVASEGVHLDSRASQAAGIGLSPSGGIDLVFFAPRGRGDPGHAMDSDAIDHVEYDIVLTSSFGIGSPFAKPIRLSLEPIRGQAFPRLFGRPFLSSQLSVASGPRYVHPVWIGTPETGSTTLLTARIERQ